MADESISTGEKFVRVYERIEKLEKQVTVLEVKNEETIRRLEKLETVPAQLTAIATQLTELKVGIAPAQKIGGKILEYIAIAIVGGLLALVLKNGGL